MFFSSSWKMPDGPLFLNLLVPLSHLYHILKVEEFSGYMHDARIMVQNVARPSLWLFTLGRSFEQHAIVFCIWTTISAILQLVLY